MKKILSLILAPISIAHTFFGAIFFSIKKAWFHHNRFSTFNTLFFNRCSHGVKMTLTRAESGKPMAFESLSASLAHLNVTTIFFNRMMACVLRSIRKLKILNSIVSFISVYMVNKFTGFKISSKMFFHYKTMFKDISVWSCMRMKRTFNAYVSLFNDTRTLFSVSGSSARLRAISSILPAKVYSKLFFTNKTHFVNSVKTRFVQCSALIGATNMNIMFLKKKFLTPRTNFLDWIFNHAFRVTFARAKLDLSESVIVKFKCFFAPRAFHFHHGSILKFVSIILLCGAVLFQSQSYCYCAWNQDEPSGTQNLSDVDTLVISNNTALQSTVSGITGWTNLKATTSGSATTVTVTADMLLLQAASSIAYRATSVSEAIAITTSGASGLVSSLSEAANTIYYVWIARKSSDGTTNGYLSTTTDLTTFLTQVDAGYDQAALVSVVGNDGSSNFLDFTQVGRNYAFVAWKSIASGNVGIGAWTAIDLTPSTLSFFVPTALSTKCWGNMYQGGASVSIAVSNINTAPTSYNGASQRFGINGNIMNDGSDSWQFDVLTTDTIYWLSNASSATVTIAGFELNKL